MRTANTGVGARLAEFRRDEKSSPKDTLDAVATHEAFRDAMKKARAARVGRRMSALGLGRVKTLAG
jgi:hypothetical protein